MRLVCGTIRVPLRTPLSAAVPDPARRTEAERADQEDETECEERHADTTPETRFRLNGPIEARQRNLASPARVHWATGDSSCPMLKSMLVSGAALFLGVGAALTAGAPAQAQVGVEIGPRGLRAYEERPYHGGAPLAEDRRRR